MDNLLDTIKKIRGRSLLEDVFLLLGGIFLLIVINFLFKPTSDLYPNWQYFTDFQRISILLVSSYFFGFLCHELGRVYIRALFSVLMSNKRDHLREFRKDFFDHLNNKQIPIKNDGSISGVELESFIAQNEGVSSVHERLNRGIMFERIFLGFFLGLVFFHTTLWVIAIVIFLTLKVIKSELHLRKYRTKTAGFLISMNAKAKNSN